MKSVSVAQVALFAALYASITYLLAPISFLQIQCRVSCALIPLIAIFGYPCLVGIVLGHFIANLFSPLGLIDLFSVAFFIPAKLLIRKYGVYMTFLHVLSVAVWVAYMLYLVLGLPFWISVLYVGIGEAIAEVGIQLKRVPRIGWDLEPIFEP